MCPEQPPCRPPALWTAPSWKALAPVALGAVLLLLPAPPGLALHAWRFFAVFAAVLLALILEPLPGGAVGLIGVAVVALFAPWMLFSPGELARPGFNSTQAALTWALAGFSNSTVWLIFGAFMFALGYEKTGLGRRLALQLVARLGRNTLLLGYAITFADLLLAPFTPSNTARSGGTVYPVVRNLPPLFDSLPGTPSARRLGSYVMWVAIAATSVTSSMFSTGLATNVLGLELVRQTTGLTLGWTEWFLAFLPVGVPLLLLVPLLAWWLYPPEVRAAPEIPAWARAEGAKLGPLSRPEMILAALVVAALGCWIFGASLLHPTLAALAVVALLVVTRVLVWEDLLAHRSAWGTLVWFATLVTMAEGLNRTGFVSWFAQGVTQHLVGTAPSVAIPVMVALFFVSHYLFASTTAHATALLPVMLAAGSFLPPAEQRTLALLLCFSLGLMGIISPYATGPSPIYANSGFLPARDYWRLGAIFGGLYLVALLLLAFVLTAKAG